MRKSILLAPFCMLMVFVGPSYCQDWPTYMHDNCRSGVTAAQLDLPLEPAWTFKALRPPSAAWPATAMQDFYHDHFDLRATDTYDWAFHVIAHADTVYFGSSSEDKVYALDAGRL